MAKFNSRYSKFYLVDTGAVERDLSAYLTEISGLPGERELNDSTTLGDSGHEREPSLENGRIRIAGFFDDTATLGPDAVLGPLRTHTSATTFKYGPKGSTATFVRYTGTCWVRNYEITSRVGELVGFSADLEVNGAITRDTF